MEREENLDHIFESDASVGTVVDESRRLEILKELTHTRFLKGAAISMWQNSGDADSNWTRFVQERRCCGLKSVVADGKTDTFPDTWNRYKEDIALLKQLNCNAFRFSIEWARIEPEQGRYDADAVDRYHQIFDCLEENGITPCVTLHHFVHPGWFQDLGGFEKEENIGLFVKFCVRVFTLFCHRAQLWATINEPTVYAFLSYMAGMHPPANTFRFKETGQVLLCLLKAHCQVYKELKALDCGKDCVIGIVHQSIWFKPFKQLITNPLCKYASDWVTFWFGRDLVLNFFKTGNFKWKVPMFGKGITYKYPDGRPPCDWWGINYYSRLQVSWYLQPACGKEIMTDMDYPIYPKGLYRSIKAGSALGIPIYITETGIADGKDNRRHLMIRGYTNELVRAIKHGFDVRGIFYWTLVDNFEWSLGYKPRFGLYEYSPDKGVDRKLREGSKVLQEVYGTWPENLKELYQYSRSTVISSFRSAEAEFKARGRR